LLTRVAVKFAKGSVELHDISASCIMVKPIYILCDDSGNQPFFFPLGQNAMSCVSFIVRNVLQSLPVKIQKFICMLSQCIYISKLLWIELFPKAPSGRSEIR